MGWVREEEQLGDGWSSGWLELFSGSRREDQIEDGPSSRRPEVLGMVRNDTMCRSMRICTAKPTAPVGGESN